MERHDLGELFARITRRLIDAERQLLSAHRLTMWEYIAMSQLARSPAPTQLALAQAIEYDKTRLITILDSLERRGILTREPDPADRRARIVRLTPAGEQLLAAARSDIRTMESALLGPLDPAERDVLLAVLPRLTGDSDTP
ncbi:MarR family transcriptional regulator [Streptomyces sp. H10-C2]|uniref:MarR family winged helix-turn-helix transcriptional regulator n=1 Tax=unclassified Streptomyces TaxID=2593676 RepID=UPI0024BB96EA|nr:MULTISPECIES: MarR family transcriptional regulator [unclassified Streptomyces]MDJ0347297.1 MarR family transcriptional regulator [Streptomyces sp. PH10-H1]MDJ0375531.1 MarR family transcriptional regulator [Streptomyces sp. H10-C2]